MNTKFKTDVFEGLSKSLKTLSSKYFYDEIGDKLFVKIMSLPEYYLTRAEYEIFDTKSEDIIEKLKLNTLDTIDIIELGAGDGKKTKAFLKVLLAENYKFRYVPIDISQHALNALGASLKTEFSDLEIEIKQGEYFGVLEDIKTNKAQKVIMFLGSNLGNLDDEAAQDFLVKLSNALRVGDKIILGLDLMKPKEIVLPAYNDSQGVTKAFNLNLLHRINRELHADFDISNFGHAPEYDEKTGIARSFLVSKKEQKVCFNGDHTCFTFLKDEKIQTETSRKYNDAILQSFLQHTNLVQTSKISDSNNYFNSYILERV
ncbi:L-histidine N(alpha)-methyltransferase [Psychroserpens burtonensis]|uniref:L-histidine N(Alpha)-methyltransferase n=1 Tax=Psychroserpens burtonensis TaxID=49278 RepID=A0A5C7B783_9FLAO|nr:L-histidine N(alpha)-methyltransferase [Psychroserpens burtonensis]TXE15946.1 L-histidine N(alpha)-methyltransferase [Psychroserpens burtonensis]